jgi:uncharacterized membrane protein
MSPGETRQHERLVAFERRDENSMETVVGLFDNHQDAERAVDALKKAGFKDEGISLLARQDTIKTDPEGRPPDKAKDNALKSAAGGGVVGGLAGLLVGIGSVVVPGLGPVIAGGALATLLGTTAAGAGIGAAAGGVIGTLTGMGVSQEEAQLYAEGVKRGGLLVIAQVEAGQVEMADTIMIESNAVDLKRAEKEWKNTGWAQFDESEDPDPKYPHIWGGFQSQR